jgi:hypothetical protein
MMETTFRAIVDRSRLVDGTHMSLQDLGYVDVGLGTLIIRNQSVREAADSKLMCA